MTDAIYAGDDYEVRLHGLVPYHDELEFLPWMHVEPAYVYPTHTLKIKQAGFLHPPGTTLHHDDPLAKRVDEHFANYGTSIQSVADNFEHLVRDADPWNITYGQGWYEHEAGHAIERMRRQGYERGQAASIIAALSPQNAWLGTENHPELGNREEAVRYGRVAMDMRHGRGRYEGGTLTITDDDANDAHARFKDARIQPGRYDISHPDPSQWDLSPRDLAELPVFHSRATRATRASAIGTALGIRTPQDLGPKTYPFYHNIMDPHSSDLVTTDTHMVTAGGLAVPSSAKGKFLSSVGGVKGEKNRIPIYKGYGQVGMASATIGATRALNRKPPPWLEGHPPLSPMHTQAIVWNEHQWRTNPKFRKATSVMRDRPWDEVFGYNFGEPHTR